LGWWFVPRVRRVALANLDRAYGDALSPAEKRRIGAGAARNAAVVAAELAHIPRIDAEFVRRHARIEGLEHLDMERGGLVIAAHLGNWEWMGPMLRTIHPRVAEVVRPLDDPGLNRVVDGFRTANGVETIAKSGAGSALFQRLREGYLVGVLIDQSPRENGAPGTFFGQPCWSTIAPAMVAARARARITPASCTRTHGGYTIRFLPPVALERTGDLRHDLAANTQRCQDAVEQLVRAAPEQWLWFHRRWKPRPRLEREWAERGSRRGGRPQ
jgi:KDO2-lipid IV(A) lauroyltransferase